MRIGYPCINTAIGCRSGSTFRLKSYSEERLLATVQANLDCLVRILEYNARHRLLFFRITSDLVPFASHPVCRCRWQQHFASRLRDIGHTIRKDGMRISMHPDQFVVLNSPNQAVAESSLRELRYHAEVLDLMGLDLTAKIQIHAGGVYGDRARSMARFIERCAALDEAVRRRLVLENDDRCYTLAHCLELSAAAGVPVLFDDFHHRIHSSGEAPAEALARAARTWISGDGPPMVDYSQPAPGKSRGSHADSIDIRSFRRFLSQSGPLDFDIMLEIKDKEKSALRAVRAARGDPRLAMVA
jgi:UV DNA damage endonuclease